MLPRPGKVGTVGRLLNGASGGSLCDLGKGSLRAGGRGRGARCRDVEAAGVDAAEAPLREGRRDGGSWMEQQDGGQAGFADAGAVKKQKWRLFDSSPGTCGFNTQLLSQLLPKQLSRRCAHLGRSKCHLQDFLL